MIDERGDGVWEERARRWLAEPVLQLVTAAALFSVFALVSGSQLHANWTADGVEASWVGLVAVRLVEWMAWAIMVPVIVALDDRARRRPRSWAALLAIHGTVATIWFALLNVVLVVLAPRVDPAAASRPFLDAYLARAAIRLSTAWVVYAAVLAAIALVRDFVRRQRLIRDLYDAQLVALRAQIQPHFLFNTLHTVGGLVRVGDRDRAIRTLVALSELLRRTMSHTREDEVPLEEELELLERYLEIQRARFGDRLTVVLEIDPATRGARVPPFVLQPLVENAIRHGLDLDHEPGSVSVDVRREAARIRIVVEDDGGTLGRDGKDGYEAYDGHDGYDGHVGNGANGRGRPTGAGGIGLANLRARLSRLYGHDQSLRLGLTARGSTAVTIEIPLRSV